MRLRPRRTGRCQSCSANFGLAYLRSRTPTSCAAGRWNARPRIEVAPRAAEPRREPRPSAARREAVGERVERLHTRARVTEGPAVVLATASADVRPALAASRLGERPLLERAVSARRVAAEQTVAVRPGAPE